LGFWIGFGWETQNPKDPKSKPKKYPNLKKIQKSKPKKHPKIHEIQNPTQIQIPIFFLNF
jgi:hypothetical protein